MTDYTKATGNTGTMMIRDTGTNIEFWLNSGNNSSYNHALPWGFTGNGQTQTGLTFDYASNAGWQRFGFFPVTTSQTITFNIGNTGTGGIGGPTSMSAYISRSSAPAVPSAPVLSAITSTSMNVTFTDGSNNGAAIDSRVIGYSTSIAAGAQFTTSSDGSTVIGGLAPGTRWYFWARTHNAKGYSPWSGPSSAVTLKVPDAPSQPQLSSVTATTVDVSFSANGNGGSVITGYQIGWGTSSTAPTNTIAASSPQVITGLTPGTVYYFWARAQNAVGFSAWSPSEHTNTVAGLYINVGGTWKQAMVYVNVGGTWKVAEPWARSVGVWNRTL